MTHFRLLLIGSTVLFSEIWVAPVDAQLYQVLPPRSMSLEANAARLVVIHRRVGERHPNHDRDFTGKEGVGPQAQEWETVFERAGLSVRIHPEFAGDKISIRQKQFGKLREVFVVGKLERNGTLIFPDRKFASIPNRRHSKSGCGTEDVRGARQPHGKGPVGTQQGPV